MGILLLFTLPDRCLIVIYIAILSCLCLCPTEIFVHASFETVAAWIVSIAPFPTIRQVQRDKSVGGLPLLPYSSMVVNSAVWITYGKYLVYFTACCWSLITPQLPLTYMPSILIFLFMQVCSYRNNQS